MKKKKYDIIYSLGRDCSCADYLKMNNLRLTSGPFDWLTNAGFEERFHLILNNFKNFMNIEDFKFLPKDETMFNDEACDYYENIKTHFYYYHDFPKGVPLSDSFNGIKEKYLRRIERFYDKINNSQKVLLVWFSHYHNTSDDVVLNLCNQLCQKFNKSIDFLIIEHEEGLTIPRKKELASNIIKYNLHTVLLDEKGHCTTLGDQKLCNQIFKQYRLKIPFHLMCKRIYFKVLAKIICPFVLNKQKKKELKRKWRNI